MPALLMTAHRPVKIIHVLQLELLALCINKTFVKPGKCLFVCLFVLGFTSHSRIIFTYLEPGIKNMYKYMKINHTTHNCAGVG